MHWKNFETITPELESRAGAITRRIAPWATDDVLQNAKLKFCSARLRPDGNHERFYLLIVKHLAMDLRKSATIKLTYSYDAPQEGETDGENRSVSEILPDSCASSEALLEQAQLVCDVETAMDCLSVEQRKAILLVDFHRMKYDQAATNLGVNIGTMRSRLNRGRQALAADNRLRRYA